MIKKPIKTQTKQTEGPPLRYRRPAPYGRGSEAEIDDVSQDAAGYEELANLILSPGSASSERSFSPPSPPSLKPAAISAQTKALPLKVAFPK